MTHRCRHIIETRTHAILRDMATTALSIGRLAIIRGPAGIGKSFALDRIAEELNEGQTQVLIVTATAANGRSIRKFFGDAIMQLGLMGGGGEPEARFAGYMMRSFPFRRYSPKILLVIDECQHLAPNVIETLRGIYDLGKDARNGDSDAPAFGLLMVGNDRFLTRGGKSERAMFEALASRCPMEWELDRPTAEETAALAAAMFPDAQDCRDAIAAFGARCGTLREMAESYALADSFAGDGKVGMQELERALVLSMGGR